MKNKLLHGIKSRLLRPHPYSSIKDTLSFSLFVMFYIAFILFINFANIELFDSLAESVLIVLVFAIAVGLLPVINSILLKYLIPKRVKENWKVIGEIIIYQIHFLSIGVVNNAIAIHYFPIEKKFSNYMINILITYAIGIFPVSFMIIRKQNKVIRNKSENMFEIESIMSERVVRSESAIYFIESVGNYLEITYSNNKKEKMRGTLKDFLKNKKGRGLNRVHRAYVANLSLVEHISGNSQGMKISFKNINKSIPVSRKYVHIVRSLC